MAIRSAVISLALASSLVIHAAARAQQAPAPATPPEAVELPPLTVSAPVRLPGAALPLSSIPGTVQVVPGDILRNSGAVSLQDALTRLPGIHLNDEQGNSVQFDLSMRGFTATSVTGVPQGISVFIDGVRVNEPTVEEVNFDLIPLQDIDHVEVIRGPSSTFGRNTLGGAINIITRRGGGGLEIVPEADWGSFGRQQYRLQAGGATGPFDFYASGTYYHEFGWRDDAVVQLGKVFAKLGFKLGDTDLTVSYQRAQNRIEQAGSLPASALAEDRTLNFTAGDFFKPLLNFGTLSLRQGIGEKTTLTANAFIRTLDAEQFNVNLLGDNTRSFVHTTSLGGSAQLDYDGTIFGRGNRVTAGVEYAHYHVPFKTLLENPATGVDTLDSKLTDNQNAFAVYLEDTFDIARNLIMARDSLVLTLGVRWDWLRHNIDDQSPVDDERPSAAGTSTFNRANPRFGINYNLTPSNGAYFTFAQGFRAPAFLELSCAGPAAVCPGLQAGIAPDPPLSPVRVNNYELGVRLRPWTWLGIEAALYRTNVIDDIFAVSPTGATGVFFQNVGNTRRQGLELDAQATLARDWDLRLNYTYTQATFRSDLELTTSRPVPGCDEPPCAEPVQKGNDLPLIPRHRLNVSVDYRVAPWLTLWVSGAFVGSQWFRGDEENVEPKLSSYFLMSAGVRARYRALSAFLTINNLLNNKYETFGTFAPNAKAPGVPIEPFLTPAPPINVVGGVSYRF